MAALDTLCDALSPGERVFVSGASGEPVGLMDALAQRGDRLRGCDIVTSFVPGINPLPLDALDPAVTMTGPFCHPGFDAAVDTGLYRHLPLAYGGMVRWLSRPGAVDSVVVQVAPPAADGRASLGPHAEFLPTLLAHACRVLAIVNPAVPAVPGAPTIDLAAAAVVAHHAAPLRTYAVGVPDAVSARIATRIAAFVGDRATIQVGIGKVPPALLALLTDRRDLRIWSGLLSPGMRVLSEAGAIADGPGAVVGCSALGDADFYAWLAGREGIAIRGCDETHDAARLAALPGLVAANAAIAVDLFGQANLDQIGDRRVSGVGGAPDFARAAAGSEGGISIVALPATTPKGESRIVAHLPAGVPVSLPRHDVDVIVTEHGAADLRGLSSIERMRAIAAVAAPEWRDALLATLPRR